MVHLRLLRAALFAWLARQLSLLEVNVGVAARDAADALLFGGGFTVRSHPCCVARTTISLPVSVARFAAATARRLQSSLHFSTITRIVVECHVKQVA